MWLVWSFSIHVDSLHMSTCMWHGRVCVPLLVSTCSCPYCSLRWVIMEWHPLPSCLTNSDLKVKPWTTSNVRCWRFCVGKIASWIAKLLAENHWLVKTLVGDKSIASVLGTYIWPIWPRVVPTMVAWPKQESSTGLKHVLWFFQWLLNDLQPSSTSKPPTWTERKWYHCVTSCVLSPWSACRGEHGREPLRVSLMLQEWLHHTA